MNFSIEKKGYNQAEVDAYVSKTNLLIDRKNEEILLLKRALESYKNKEHNVSVALTAAIEKAKEIEGSSKNVYDLKIQQISLLYSKWGKLLSEMLVKYPEVEGVTDVQEEMESLKEEIKKAVKEDFDINVARMQSQDPMRNLLMKVSSLKQKQAEINGKEAENKDKKKVIPRTQKIALNKEISELNRLEEKSMIKPIANVKMSSEDSYENGLDKFFNDEELESNAYINKLTKKKNTTIDDMVPNETGFDLKEAVNPKDDLEEIMKAFDFFDSDDK